MESPIDISVPPSSSESINKVQNDTNNAWNGIPAKNSKGDHLLLFVGIIDILQSYVMMKKLEHLLKSTYADGDTVSVHHPKFYANRFQNFMKEKVFVKAAKPNRWKSFAKQKILNIKAESLKVI